MPIWYGQYAVTERHRTARPMQYNDLSLNSCTITQNDEWTAKKQTYSEATTGIKPGECGVDDSVSSQVYSNEGPGAEKLGHRAEAGSPRHVSVAEIPAAIHVDRHARVRWMGGTVHGVAYIVCHCHDH